MKRRDLEDMLLRGYYRYRRTFEKSLNPSAGEHIPAGASKFMNTKRGGDLSRITI